MAFIYPSEHQQLLESQEFLFKVRFALHLILKRYDNRLLFDRQNQSVARCLVLKVKETVVSKK